MFCVEVAQYTVFKRLECLRVVFSWQWQHLCWVHFYNFVAGATFFDVAKTKYSVKSRGRGSILCCLKNTGSFEKKKNVIRKTHKISSIFSFLSYSIYSISVTLATLLSATLGYSSSSTLTARQI